MASTNKTTNLGLSQFVAEDKPSWLTDYNSDMLAVDLAMKNAAGTYSHGKVDSTHVLNGRGNDIRFTAVADFNAGDTLMVNGEAVHLPDGGAGFRNGDDVLLLRKGSEVQMLAPLRGKVPKEALLQLAADISPKSGKRTYAKTENGVVLITARVYSNTSNTAFTNRQVATLPVGFRPNISIFVPIAAKTSAGVQVPAILEITADGALLVQCSTGGIGEVYLSAMFIAA